MKLGETLTLVLAWSKTHLHPYEDRLTRLKSVALPPSPAKFLYGRMAFNLLRLSASIL